MLLQAAKINKKLGMFFHFQQKKRQIFYVYLQNYVQKQCLNKVCYTSRVWPVGPILAMSVI